MHTTYGLLEQLAQLSYNDPDMIGNPAFTATLSGGYSNVQNITTFQAKTLQGDFRVTQKYKLADTFIYDFQFRRISVNANSLEISPNLIPLYSQPVSVGGPGLTYFHDTRDPSPLNATRGQFLSVPGVSGGRRPGFGHQFQSSRCLALVLLHVGQAPQIHLRAQSARWL